MKMIRKVEQYIKKYHMIENGDRIVLGVSGGADSVSLFFVMLALKEKYNIEIAVVHVNHGIRGKEAQRDEDYVKELCRMHQVVCECVHLDIRSMAKEEKLSEEEMGRKARYDAFRKAMKKYACNKIAVAHNKNDITETVLLNLFRGSGLKGLVGIEPVRKNLIRPLLCVERIEIETYLKEQNILYHEDATNFETDYTRNKIRLRVLPYVKEQINEKVSDHIVNASLLIGETNQFIEQETQKLYGRSVKLQAHEAWILLEQFTSAYEILKKELIRKVLFELAEKQKDIELSHVEMILELEKKGAGKKVDLPYEMEAVHQYDKIVIRKKEEHKEKTVWEWKAPIPGRLEIGETGTSLHFEVFDVTEKNQRELENLYSNKKNDYTKWFDYDKIRNTVLVRNRKTGDFFEYNARGNRKKLKDYFINEKLPAGKRDSILLLADGNHIMWIMGYRISEYYKIGPDTKKVLKVNVDGGNEHD